MQEKTIPVAPQRRLKFRSVEQGVYQALRVEIIHGLAPGSPLRLRQLASEFGTSTMPVREALDQLTSEGLCVKVPRRGTVVAPVSHSELIEIQTIRIGLEAQALLIAVPQLSSDLYSEVKGLWEQVSVQVTRGELNVDDYLSSINTIHLKVYSATCMNRLLDLIEQHRRMFERYLRLAFSQMEDVAHDVPMQRCLVNAILDKDSLAAEQSLRTMLQWTADEVGARLNRNNGKEGE